MRRTVNQTGRKRILLEYVTFTPDSTGLLKTISAAWDLSALGLSTEDELFIEVDSFANVQRIPLGLVGNGIGTHTITMDFIRDLRTAKLKLFTVSLSSGVRLISSTSTNVPVVFDIADSESSELLKVQKIDELETLWKVDYRSAEPILQVCNRGGLYPTITKSAVFFAAILPAAVQDIAYTIFSETVEIQEEVRGAWITYFKTLGLSDDDLAQLAPSSDDDEVLNLNRITKAADLAARFSVVNNLIERVASEAEQNANT